MKKHLLMLIAILGIATAFTSCEEKDIEGKIGVPYDFYNVWIFADDANGNDVFEQYYNESINSTSMEFSAEILNNDHLFFSGNISYTNTSLQNDDWVTAHVSTGYKTNKKSVNINVWGFTGIVLNTLYSELSYSIFFPDLFGDNENHILTLQLDYDNESIHFARPVKVILDNEKEIDFDVVSHSDGNYIMLNFTLD